MKKKEDGMMSEEEKVGVLLFFFWKGGGREGGREREKGVGGRSINLIIHGSYTSHTRTTPGGGIWPRYRRSEKKIRTRMN